MREKRISSRSFKKKKNACKERKFSGFMNIMINSTIEL